MIALDRIMNDPKPPTLASLPPTSLQLGNDRRRAERRNVLLHLQRDVTRMTRRQRRPPPMRIATRRPRVTAGARPRPAPLRPRCEIQLQPAPRADLPRHEPARAPGSDRREQAARCSALEDPRRSTREGQPTAGQPSAVPSRQGENPRSPGPSGPRLSPAQRAQPDISTLHRHPTFLNWFDIKNPA